MDKIEAFFEEVKDKVGDKGFIVLIGVTVIFFLYNLVKGSGSSDDDLTPVTMVSSYPDAVTNANVIIDTLQSSIEYSEGIILDHITDTSEATNDYINQGLESQNKLMQESFDELKGSITDIITDHDTTVNSSLGSIQTSQTQIQESVNEIKNDLNNNTIKNTVTNAVNEALKKNNTTSTSTNKTTTSSTKKTTTSSTNKTTTSSAKKTTSDTYTYKTKKGLNTSTSIVDALKATGVNSSFANRKKIAEANGIKNYTGSASQNVSLLNKLKGGTLKKV